MATQQTTAATEDCNRSPEFEFWMLRNPSYPQPHIHSADELFADGVLLPLHLLPTSSNPPPPQPSPSITDSATTLSTSKRWKDIFRKSNTTHNNRTEDQDKSDKSKHKKERKNAPSGSAAELNINIWPFSRSRSAGNAATRPKLFPGAPTTRKSNSAPCSRSNSAGDSKSRKCPTSPARPGLHVGRSSPVWQVRRARASNPEPQLSKRDTSASRRSKAAPPSSSSKGSVLNLNVPTCISYTTNFNCRSHVNNTSVASSNSNCNNKSYRDGDGDRHGNGISNGVHDSSSSSSNSNNRSSHVGGKLFTLRSLFAKKTLLTSH